MPNLHEPDAIIGTFQSLESIATDISKDWKSEGIAS